ncbi:MAG: beta-galactosidase, partial [Terrimicrobiaceae bacterium]
MDRRFLLISVIAILLLVSVASVFHLGKREKAGEGAHSISSDNETKTLPPISLRGFGKVSGKFQISASGTGILTITCQDAEHANLLQAKYLSDLNAILPANRRMMSLHSGQLEIHELAGLGVAAAVRRDSQVYLLAAADEENLKAVVEKNREIPQTLELSQAGTKVPMFLDRWDKFGFRFYYRPFERPKDTAAANYDPLGEFAFAEKMGPTGLIFWANIDQNDSSEGLTNEAWWEWAFDEARKRDLPVGIATMLNSPASAWFYNRFRGEMMQKMPQYMGTFYRPGEKILSSNGFLSFNSASASTFNLAAMQEILRRKATASNVVTVLEPHGELRHGPHEIFLEYGPTADAGYQTFLQEKYRSISALNQAWGAQFGSWKQVRVPEVASFLGWGPQALDLTGAWRIGYEPLQGEGADLEKLNAHDIARKLQGILPTKGAPREWFAENFDDSAWPQIVAPGDDRALFLESRPAVYRRNFDLPADWLTPKKKIWLYVWDLNSGTG